MAPEGAQTTLDPAQIREWMPNNFYGGHAFGFAWDPKNHQSEFEHFLGQRETVLPWIEKYSPYALLSADAPLVYLSYPGDAPAYGEEKKDPNHSANYGRCWSQRQRSWVCLLSSTTSARRGSPIRRLGIICSIS